MTSIDSPISHDQSGPAAIISSDAAVDRLKALIFDVDGTLYEQAPVRRAMLYRILRANLNSPIQGMMTLQALRSYRKAHEELRHSPPDSGGIASTQLLLASKGRG